MSELQRDDIISSDALQAPLILAENLQKVVSVLKVIRDVSEKTNVAAQTSNSISEVAGSVEGLVNQEKELVKVNNQLAITAAKNNEQYAMVKKKVDEANQSLKNRIALGERDALTITRQNASLKELQAALTKNRQAYAALTSEQSRNSSEGKKLLAAIQQQDKDFKHLSGTLGQHQAHVGDYAGQLGKANTAAQTITPALHGMANALLASAKAAWAFVKTPLGITLTVLTALLSPIIAYFTSTAEGMDRVDVATAKWKATLQVLKDRLTDTGKNMIATTEEASKFNKELEKGPRNFIQNWGNLISNLFPKLSKDIKEARESAAELAKTLDEVSEGEAKWGVEVAELELQQQRLILQSKNRTLTEEERLSKLDEAIRLEEQIKDKRIEFADKELEAVVNAAADILATEQKVDQTLVGGERVAAYRKFAKELIDLGREKDDAISESLIGSLLKQTEAEKASVTIEEKVQTQRDVLSDKRLDRLAKETAAAQKAADAELDLYRARYEEQVRLSHEQYLKEKEIRDKEAKDQKALIDGINVRNEDRKAREKKQSEDRIKQLEKEKEANIKHLEEMLFYYQDYSNAILNLTGSITANRIQSIDLQLKKLDEQTEYELKMAGDNAVKKEQIELTAETRRRQLEKKRLEEIQKQARFEKAVALTQAGINTALAITKVIPNPILMALAAALGAIQVAAIAAKPIPQFFKGTESSPEGLAFVGERGSELKVEPSGKMSLTPGVPTLDYLKAGTQIIPHDETMKMLALSAFGKESLIQRDQTQQIDLAHKMERGHESIVKAIRSSRQGNLFKQGSLTYEQVIKGDKSKQFLRRSTLGQ